MDKMPSHRPPHLHREKTRHGKFVWYARIGGSSRGPRLRLHAEYGTAEFWDEYQAALASIPLKPKIPHAGTLAWLLERYRETTVWTSLSLATRRQRENIFKHVLATAGKQPFAKITAAAIIAGRDRRANTPVQARKFLDAMRGLFRWAMKAGLVKTDPTVAVDNVRAMVLPFGAKTT
jgi:hypothetical protein